MRKYTLFCLALMMAVSAFGCGGSKGGGIGGGGEASSLSEVKERHTPELMAIPGVVGVGIGGTPGEEHLVVYLENGSPELKARIPTELEGYKVATVVTGAIKPL